MRHIRFAPFLLVGSFLLSTSGFVASLTARNVEPGTRNPEPGIRSWADSVFATLTLEQKIGQLFVVPASGRLYNENDEAYRRLVQLVGDFEVGGVIFFGGEPVAQAFLTNDLQARATVPLLISQDMEWGPGMRLPGTTEFPRTMTLGASRNPDLAYAMGRVVAAEARSIGVHVNFAPVADVNNNPANPVINVRSFGEDPDLVGTMAAAYVRGLQDGGVIATSKHFPGHGDTDVDSHLGLPVLSTSRARLDSLELAPFRKTIEAGVGAIMIAHIALPKIDSEGLPATLSGPVVTDLLRNDLGYDGLVVTDAMRMDGITQGFGSGEAAVRSLNAGVDQILLPDDFYAARRAVVRAVEKGEISMERIDAAVQRVLRVKETVGLFEYTPSSIDSVRSIVGDPAADALAGEIARQGITLLANQDDLIPISDTHMRILDVTLSDTDWSGQGRSFSRMLARYTPDAEMTRVLLDRRSHTSEYESALGLSGSHDLAIVQAYMLVRTGTGRVGLDPAQRAFMDSLLARDIPVILIAFGNPYIAMGVAKPEAYIAAYGSSDATLQATAQAIFGQVAFRGKLPVTLPGLFAYGDGIETLQSAVRFGMPEDAGISTTRLSRLDTLLWNAIEDSAFPSAAVAVGRAGVVARTDGFGYFTYESEQRITTRSLFDLASLTKVVATTPAIMVLYDRGLIELHEPLATYVPEFGGAGKDSVTVRQILTHTSGLAPFHAFELMGISTEDEVLDFLARDSLIYEPDTEYRYSDLGMIMLAIAVERISGREFGAFLAENVYDPLGMHDTGFRPAGGLGIDTTIVPTEIDRFFRKRLVQGEVHDERAWILGGTAGHAGLFSTVEDLSRYASMMLSGGAGNGVRIFKKETVDLFTTRVENNLGHTRALGWDTPTIGGDSSAGSFFGPRSYGHTGFTGTSIWIDPDADLFVILLTNRVYPSRSNEKLRQIRPRVADIVYTSTTGPATLDLERFTKEPY